jgi:hypothetical protein
MAGKGNPKTGCRFLSNGKFHYLTYRSIMPICHVVKNNDAEEKQT